MVTRSNYYLLCRVEEEGKRVNFLFFFSKKQLFLNLINLLLEEKFENTTFKKKKNPYMYCYYYSSHITLIAPEVWDDKFCVCGDWGSPILSSRASASKLEAATAMADGCNCCNMGLLGEVLGEGGMPDGWPAIGALGLLGLFGIAITPPPPLLPIFTNGSIGTFGDTPTCPKPNISIN